MSVFILFKLQLLKTTLDFAASLLGHVVGGWEVKSFIGIRWLSVTLACSYGGSVSFVINILIVKSMTSDKLDRKLNIGSMSDGFYWDFLFFLIMLSFFEFVRDIFKVFLKLFFNKNKKLSVLCVLFTRSHNIPPHRCYSTSQDAIHFYILPLFLDV